MKYTVVISVCNVLLRKQQTLLPYCWRMFIRSVTNSEYKDLRFSGQPVTKFLFGENLPQVLKELYLTNKLGSRPINKLSYPRNRGYAKNKGYYKQNSFLGRGRSNPNHEPWKQRRKHQKRQCKIKWQVLNLCY